MMISINVDYKAQVTHLVKQRLIEIVIVSEEEILASHA